MDTPKVTIAELVELLKTEDQSATVQFLVVSSQDGAILKMDLRSDLVDVEKLMKAFKKPSKTAR